MAPGLVDWGLAERIGARVANRPSPLTSELPALQREMEAQAPLAESLVTEVTGLVPSGPARIEVVDRPAWVAANVAAFRRLLAPLLERWQDKVGHRPGMAATLTSRVAAVELGTLLGWMSSRVLGQYDLLLGDPAGNDGRRAAQVTSCTSSVPTWSAWNGASASRRISSGCGCCSTS